ncbi:MAG: ornithine cyclodeaminase family protein [Acidimicrobiales bacterium]
MTQTTQWISEHDVVSVLDLADALEALRAGFTEEGEGTAAALDKTLLGYGDHATLHALGAAFTGGGYAGTKVWTHTPGGADPVLVMFDVRTGAVAAVIEAFALGQLRTSGTAALATDLLARPEAAVLAVVGTGKQALPQVAAVAQVRALTEVRAFSPDRAHREAFARRVTAELGLACRAVASAEEAVAGADVVTLVTRATEPVLTEAMVEPGVHVNAVGAIDLRRRELEPAILGRCAAVVTDSLPQVRALSGELRTFYGDDPSAWEAVRTLGDVAARGAGVRGPEDVTVFKAMGSGIEDVALGMAVLERLAGRQASVPPVERHGRAAPALRPPSRAQ